ncbi:MAG: hypothetical protein JWP08_2861 [Bryobacterales bacterium]|nr:hypothetical protein [Bryobacterales bacterium]
MVSWTRKSTSEQRWVDRARIILLSQEGLTVEKISERLETRPARVSKWRQRFVRDRLNALSSVIPDLGFPQEVEPGTLDHFRADEAAISAEEDGCVEDALEGADEAPVFRSASV